ncbi:MAG: 6-carboxytetrahydropterin synthase [Sedimentisphaerales bacterium]|nr:6-carboxytetrahydropterin synthase [Sedimentisphaerales bacterium]
MHKLVRCIRFSINPFLSDDSQGYNSFASRPAGEGLSIFFELWVGLCGEIEMQTGFVVNVADIDKCVRSSIVPAFGNYIRDRYRTGRHIGLGNIFELLNSARETLAEKFRPVMPGELSLKLNPFRKVAIDCGLSSKSNDARPQEAGETKMVYLSEKFEFAATHKLWNDEFSQQRNLEVFGNCANPTGHGHNYALEVTVKKDIGKSDFCIGEFEKVVHNELITRIDHKNLNVDVPEFNNVNPTVENIATYAWQKLAGKFGDVKLNCVTVWETDKTYCSYYGR